MALEGLGSFASSGSAHAASPPPDQRRLRGPLPGAVPSSPVAAALRGSAEAQSRRPPPDSSAPSKSAVSAAAATAPASASASASVLIESLPASPPRKAEGSSMSSWCCRRESHRAPHYSPTQSWELFRRYSAMSTRCIPASVPGLRGRPAGRQRCSTVPRSQLQAFAARYGRKEGPMQRRRGGVMQRWRKAASWGASTNPITPLEYSRAGGRVRTVSNIPPPIHTGNSCRRVGAWSRTESPALASRRTVKLYY